MAERLLIIMLNTDLTNPAAVSAPLFQAAIAASMEFDVEVVLTGTAAHLAEEGVAEKLSLQGGAGMNVYELLQQAHEAGVRFAVCSSSREVAPGRLIAEVEETVGTAQVIGLAMDKETVTFTY